MKNMSKIIIKKSHPNHVTQHQNVIGEKKAECSIEGNCQVNDVVYKCDATTALPEKVSWTCRGRME